MTSIGVILLYCYRKKCSSSDGSAMCSRVNTNHRRALLIPRLYQCASCLDGGMTREHTPFNLNYNIGQSLYVTLTHMPGQSPQRAVLAQRDKALKITGLLKPFAKGFQILADLSSSSEGLKESRAS
jgi:hypothetical protein